MEETKIIIALQPAAAACSSDRRFGRTACLDSRRSSACGVANRAIFLPHAAALFSLQLPRAAVTEGFDALEP